MPQAERDESLSRKCLHSSRLCLGRLYWQSEADGRGLRQLWKRNRLTQPPEVLTSVVLEGSDWL